MHVVAPRKRAFTTTLYLFFLWMAAPGAADRGRGLSVHPRITLAIRRLAAAAEAFGRGRNAAFKPHGAKEVRQAAAAFNRMQGRITALRRPAPS